MRSSNRSDLCISCGVLFVAVLALGLVVFLPHQLQAESPQGPLPKWGPRSDIGAEKDAGGGSGGNSKCYVCHAGLKEEEITVSHLEMDVTCDECHGPSIEHMHDEMLMTKPDLLFGRSQVNKMCSNPTCHKPLFPEPKGSASYVARK